MNSKHSSNVYYFVAVLFFLTAWWIASLAQGGHGTWFILLTLIAFAGMGLAIEGVRAAVPEPSPFPGRAAKILWALRPRLWLIAWSIIIWVAWVYGTPHLAWNYPPRLPAGQCEYIGINGVVRTHGHGDGSLNGCRAIRLL